IDNLGDDPLKLSIEKDKLEMLIGPRTIAADLAPDKSNAAWWNALPSDLREVLAYPESVDSTRHDGAKYLYVLFPANGDEAPSGFRISIDSLNAPIELMVPPKTGA